MAFSSDRAGGAGPRGNLPTRDDVDKMARIVTSELEIAKFDRILLKSVAKNVSRALSTFAANAENRVRSFVWGFLSWRMEGSSCTNFFV